MRVSYYVQGRDKSIYFTPDGVTFLFTEGAANGDAFQLVNYTSERRRWAVKLDFVEPNPGVVPAGEDRTLAVISYFRGPSEQWITALPTYARVAYRNLWPGVDLVYGGTTDRLKYQFVVQPGADPDRIRLLYRGAEAVHLNDAGQMVVSNPLGGFHDERPYAYQKSGGKEAEVAASYRLGSSGVFGFEVGDYDPTLPLIIDPAVLVSVAYIGGFGNDQGNAIAVDAAGNAYITGGTNSFDGFPTVVGPDLTFNGGMDAFVAKLNPAGTSLIYAGYIGGAAGEAASDIAVDNNGNAYVTGNTQSSEKTFPVAVGPDLTFNGGSDAFVAKIDPSGTTLVFAGYVGGGNLDQANGIAADGTRNVYLVGWTDSAANTFPVNVGPDLSSNGARDAFVAKVSSDGAGLVYAGYIGGTAADAANDVAVDSAGNALVTGITMSGEGSFPVNVGPSLTYGGGDGDAFVAKVNASGAALDYCGYIGGAGAEAGNGIAVDDAGRAYVAGGTQSAEDTFPEVGGPDLTYNGNTDGFVAKVNGSGTALDFAGYIGGSEFDNALDVAVDAGGHAYLTGRTRSGPDTFPLKAGPDPTYGGVDDGFIAKVTVDGSEFVYAGYVGGVGDERGLGIATDVHGSAYITGFTNSPGETFSLPPALGDLNGTGETSDVFVAKISTAPVISGVFNAASWIPEGPAAHGIAQGSMFVVTGANLGPDPLVFPGNLPLPTAMEGTSIDVTVGGLTVTPFMVYTWSNQIAAVLPSATPTGQGTFTVTCDGETSAPFPILVVSNAFGIFTRNQSGYGPAIVQNWYSPQDVRVNSLIDSAIEDQYEILWGSGLGAIAGDDSGVPPVGDLNVDAQVLVNGKPAVVHYKGRSAEFPGIDQIQFQVPAGVEGCYASIAVIVNGVVSNFGTMAIHTGGGAFADSVSFSAADLEPLAQGQQSRFGGIYLLSLTSAAPGVADGEAETGAEAEFSSVSPASMLQSLGPVGFYLSLSPMSVGGCSVYQGLGEDIDIDDRAPRQGLNAGEAMNLTGGFGVVEMELDGSTYSVGADETIDPGLYTFSNGAGGTEVGPFQASITVPASQFAWTNKAAILNINRAQDLTLTWSGGDDGQEIVAIVGYSARKDLGARGTFSCAERISAGQFTVPAWILSTLPASSPWDGEGDPTSLLAVARVSRFDQNRFTASGLDAGFLFYVLVDGWVVPYE